jgi:hypothetical protein
MLKSAFAFVLGFFILSVEAKTQFSSRYLDTTSDCTCLEKGLQEGQDCTQFKCKEMAGYHVHIKYDGSACDSGVLEIGRGSKELISIKEVPPKLEWRFADDHPFAVIYRLKGPSKSCLTQGISTTGNETLVVAGLEKFHDISGQVKAKIPNANAKAREIADKGFVNSSKKAE